MNLPNDPLFDLSRRARLKRLAVRIINTRYFFIALLAHIVFLAFFSANVIVKRMSEKGVITAGPSLIKPDPSPTPSPPVRIPPSNEGRNSIGKVSPMDSLPGSRAIISVPGKNSSAYPPFDPGIQRPDLTGGLTARGAGSVEQPFSPTIIGTRTERGRYPIINSGQGIQMAGTEVIARFTCYVGQYEGGDWDCNLGFLADNRWYGNCIYNLMLQISRWTKDRIHANLQPEFLKLSSRDWIEKVRPPFIFITGHQDFHLNDVEIQNLREYLLLGGALWVDNSLPGRKSRFDVAVRREMAKVLPDRQFEKIGRNHPLYSCKFRFENGPPPGVNYYQEPVEVIRIGSEREDVAVLYTLNAYSDLWETALTANDKIDLTEDWVYSRGRIPRWGTHYGPNAHNFWQRQVFYRNVTPESIVNAYRFGINLTVYLLTRFQARSVRLPDSTI